MFGLSWLVGLVIVFVPAGLGVRETTLSHLIVNTGVAVGYANIVSVASRLIIASAELSWTLTGLVFAWLSRGYQSQDKPN
jgi:hypothetical protein